MIFLVEKNFDVNVPELLAAQCDLVDDIFAFSHQ